MKRLLIIFLLASTPAFAQFGSKRVRADTLVSFRDTAFVIVNDSLRVVNYVELDSVKTPPCPPQGRINLLSKGIAGIFVQFSNCNQTRLDSTWDSVRVASLSDSTKKVNVSGIVGGHNLSGTTKQVILSASGTGSIIGSNDIVLSTPQNIDTAAHVQFEDLSLRKVSATPRIFFADPRGHTLDMAFTTHQLFFKDSSLGVAGENTLLTLDDSLNTVGIRSPPANIDGLKLDATGLPNNATGTHGIHVTYTARGSDTAEAHGMLMETFLRNTNLASEMTGYGGFAYRDSNGVKGSLSVGDFHLNVKSGVADSGNAGLSIGMHSQNSNPAFTNGIWLWSGDQATYTATKSISNGLLISGGVSGAGGFHKAITYRKNDGATLFNGTVSFQVDSLGDVFSLPLTDKAVLYSNAGIISPLAVNSTATKKYVQQVSSGTPTLAQVDFADLSGTADLTTQVTGILPTANGGTGNGTFTIGSVVFTGTGGVYRQDNTGFFYDSTNHRLALGTITPGSPLVVKQAQGTGTPTSITMWNSTAVAADQGERLLFAGGTAGNGLATINAAFGGNATTNGGYMFFTTRAPTSGTLTEAMRIDTLQRVGIGTTAPGELLQVGSTATASSNLRINTDATSGNGPGLILYRGTTNTASINVDDVAMNLSSITSVPMRLLTKNTIQVTIDTLGAITENAVTRGQHSFTGTNQNDTVTVAGAGTGDFYFITLVGTAAPSANDAVRVEALVGKFAVHRAASGTSGLTYNWFRRK